MVKSKRNGGDIVVENTFLLETLKQLVEIPSVTGQEQQVGEYIFTALQACGMDTVSRQDIGGADSM